jgi:hypothetical protein
MRSLVVCIAVAATLGLARAEADAPTTTVLLRMRVEDGQGKPITNARGTLFQTTPQSNRSARSDSVVVISKKGPPMIGGTDGVLQTTPLPLKQAYVLEIDAEGFAPELTRWTNATQSGTIDLPVVKLRRLGVVKGMVVNRQGEPLASVTVIQAGDGPKRLEVVTDQQGHFVLEGVPEGQAVACFEASGYRFFGSVLACPSDNARIELERVADPHPRALKRAPLSSHEWTEDRRKAESKKLMEPLITTALAAKVVDETNLFPLLAAARIDPERVLAVFEQLKFARPGRQALIRNTITDAMLSRNKSPEASLAAIAKLKDPETQLDSYLAWLQSDHAKHVDPATRRQVFKRTRDLLAASKAVNSKWFYLCRLATFLWDAGEREMAHEVFDECRTLLNKMPNDAPGRESFRIRLAMAVSRESVGETKKLATDLEPGPMLLVAGEIARHHFEEVEAFLAEVPTKLSLMQLNGVANNLPELIYRVARRDPAAAERLLLKFANPPQAQSDAESVFGLGGGLFGNLSKDLIDFEVLKVKAICYGLLAEAALGHDPAAARHALLQAVELIRPQRTGFVHPANQFYHTPAGLMIQLVPIAERVDPALANEIYWRALSLRISMSGESFERLMLDVDTPDVLNLVRFYDEPLAVRLLEPVLSRLVSETYSGMPTYIWCIQTLTLLDPQRAIAFPGTLSGQPGWDGTSPRNSATQIIASVLTNDSLWDKKVDRRIKNQLARVHNVYGAYIDLDDE